MDVDLISKAADPLDTFGLAPSISRILRYFLLRPAAVPHSRQLQRVLDLGGASLQRDLERLVLLGMLERIQEGRRVRYAVVEASRLWTAFRLMIGETSDPTMLIRDALLDVAGIQAAFVFGSVAKGTSDDNSDIDVFVVEDAELDQRVLLRQLTEAGLLLGREVNTVRYTIQSLAERLGNPNHTAAHFVRDVLEGQKRWIAGMAAVLVPLATAAGLQMPDTMAVTA